MALNLKKRNLANYDIEFHTDISGSMGEKDCPGGVSRYQYAKGWAMTMVKEAEAFDDDGPTVGFFDDRMEVFENTTFAKVEGVFAKMGPRGTTNTAQIVGARVNDYLDKRLGKKGEKGGWLSKGTPDIPANPSLKKRLILVVTDGKPDSQSALEKVIIEATKRMKAAGLTKDDLVITFIQVGNNAGAKEFLETLNNGLESKGAAMDIVGCITCDQAKGLSTQQLLEKACDAE